MSLHRLLALALACAFPLVAGAQWQWTDNTGRRVFSDQPPPADIPAKNILRQPGVRAPAAAASGAVAAASAAVPAASAPASAASAPAKSASGPRGGGLDKALEDKRKQAAAAEAEKKKAEQDKLAAARAENCERAKQAKATLDSGMRIQQTNAKGEREYLSDAGRASETRRLQEIIDSDCKPL